MQEPNAHIGFVAPDTFEKALDLDTLLIHHPAATFYVKVEGNAMEKEGILVGDILIVDRALTPKPQGFVVAIIEGEFRMQRWKELQKKPHIQVWGVVTYVIHKCAH